MARQLGNVIDYATAPLVQWEPAIGEPLSAGKKHEDALIHRAVSDALHAVKARNVTGVIADEARLELYVASRLPEIQKITHLTLTGAFQKAASRNVEQAHVAKNLGAELVEVTTDIDSIKPKSQDAVVMNMILGCLATGNNHQNIHKMLCFVATLLKPDGHLLVVRPNPAGGEFSTYKCTTASCNLESGKDYSFIVKGLEEYGEMKNLYTPDQFMGKQLQEAGFELGRTEKIYDRAAGRRRDSPFLINVCKIQ